MSYLHPDYDAWYNERGGPHVFKAVRAWRAYNPEWDHLYDATEYEDGWFSVDTEEWFGEFPSRSAAEAYLGLAFQEIEQYDEEHDNP